jgi:ABC-type amino acid transport substrate-binding protein
MIRMTAAAAAATALMVGTAFAQSGIPPELFDNTRRVAGDSLIVCFDQTSLSRHFDQAIAEAIGDALFLEVKVIEGFGGFPLNGEGFVDELSLAMNNSCDMFMGISVSVNSPISEAFAVTRPYASVPFVVAVNNTEWQSLSDVPKDLRLGTAMASLGELNLINWNLQQPEDQRWRRLPYPDPNLMATRVLDGTLGGMILWQPVLAQLQREREDAKALRTVASQPLPESMVRVGALVSSRNTFLRDQVDQAIDALVADGSIAAIMDEFGYTGHAGE